MSRYAPGFAAFLLLLASAPTLAQDWARKMFDEMDHDFGVVARGSDTVFKFPVKNLYKDDVVLESVRSSCGCTSADLEHPIIKSHETGYIVAKFNTRTFTGVHSATLTVQISKPYPAQVQVRVHGNIRGDVVFEPGSIEFGQVDQGTAQEQKITVSYAGRSGWNVDDVRSSSDYLEAELVQRERNGGRVIYDLVTRLRESAPAGYLKTQLILVTNDASNPRIPLEVSADVRPELTVAPDTIVLGDVQQGDSVTKKLMVRGKRPFKIVQVTCEEDCLTFEKSDAANDKQIVTVNFTAKGEPRRVKSTVTFVTDLGETFTASCDVYATITAPPATAADQGGTTADASASTTASVN
ncbi:DUF1573 domain-containing protein [Botrimarina mediterranea]|uniref:DUF1573 domain-containing protein n=1 Tax=Botrimarina mediterranea TaxID=2528022 RepID=A0A518K5R6_9BACT|nr:DUF1573 domain-containing protein [Botrimarina mediterranea]QDV73134.1 hypothetical protein Spa11_13260 [Botrimarina mediterranea]QDV77707.1 hypothetical protein K2D_13080 [Planctomycetes bacterium K2D]